MPGCSAYDSFEPSAVGCAKENLLDRAWGSSAVNFAGGKRWRAAAATVASGSRYVSEGNQRPINGASIDVATRLPHERKRSNDTNGSVVVESDHPNPEVKTAAGAVVADPGANQAASRANSVRAKRLTVDSGIVRPLFALVREHHYRPRWWHRFRKL